LQTITVECTSYGNTKLLELKSQYLPFSRKFVSAFFVVQEEGTECEEEWTSMVSWIEEVKVKLCKPWFREMVQLRVLCDQAL
jgi:hypothetical protein